MGKSQVSMDGVSSTLPALFFVIATQNPVEFLVSRSRWSERRDRLAGNLGWLLLPLIVILAWRLWARRLVSTHTLRSLASPPPPPGASGDSELYRSSGGWAIWASRVRRVSRSAPGSTRWRTRRRPASR